MRGGALLFTFLTMPLVAQVPQPEDRGVDSYWYNRTQKKPNEEHDTDLGEFYVDLGGHIPAADLESNHAIQYTNGPPYLLDDFLDHGNDLIALEAALKTGIGTSSGQFLPLLESDSSASIVADGGNPYSQDVWWDATPDLIDVYRYVINGGYAEIARLADPPENDEVHILVYNWFTHISDLAPNDLSLADAAAVLYGKNPLLLWENGQQNLVAREQALKRGDVVVSVLENVGESLWIQLQRNQEAEYFVRNKFLPDLIAAQSFSQDVGESFLGGDSWGANVATIFSLWQPHVWSGSAATIGSDLGFMLRGDFRHLSAHLQCGLGGLGGFSGIWPSANREMYMTYLPIDILGTRFDNPEYGKGWEFAAFSVTHRRGDLAIPVHGLVGTADLVTNFHWQVNDFDEVPNGNYAPWNLMFTGHLYKDIFDGKNESFVDDGDTWETLLAASSGTTTAERMIPTTDPEYDVYPDPYTHTLRKTTCQGYCPYVAADFLIPFDLMPDDVGEGTSEDVVTVGQGTWLGFGDTMEIDDLDGDGNPELFFGNFDGFFHVMEFDRPSINDLPVLTDEYKSPWLGTGVWSMARKVGGNNKVYLGNWMGELHTIKFNSGYVHNGIASPLGTAQANIDIRDNLYEGFVGAIYRGDFRPNVNGNELLVLNRFLDWVLLDKDGGFLYRMERGHAALGPGMCASIEGLPAIYTDIEDDFEGDMIIVPCQDGHIWVVGVNDQNELIREELIGFTNRALYRVVPIDGDNGGAGDGVPEQLLLFGRNDSLPDGEKDRVMLLDLTASSDPMIVDEAVDVRWGGAYPSFAWMDPPESAAGDFTFAVGAYDRIQKISVGQSPLDCNLYTHVDALPGVDFDPTDPLEDLPSFAITSLAFYEDPEDSDNRTLFAGLANGRIFCLEEDQNGDLIWSTHPDDEISGKSTELPWYTNRTFAHEKAADLYWDDDEPYLYLGEFQHAVDQDTGGSNEFRAGRLHIASDTSFDALWDESVTEALNVSGGETAAPLVRTLDVADYDGNGTAEYYFLAETGAVQWDATESDARLFCTRSGDPDNTLVPRGGYLYEALDVANQEYTRFAGFTIPHNPDDMYGVNLHLFDNGGLSSADWWSPTVGDDRWSGQISFPRQSVNLGDAGSSVTLARLYDPRDEDPEAEPVEHVVVGTLPGYVFAILPGEKLTWNPNPPPNTEQTPAFLSYASPDLGWHVIGMDAADLDDDGEDEIVVGNWIDPGTFDDWTSTWSTAKQKNRGLLMILDPSTTVVDGVNTFEVTEILTGDDLEGPNEQGLGSGVFGIKIDDVDGDGDFEIWGADAGGRLFLFGQGTGGAWEGWFHSRQLGAYPGYYDNIHVIKEDPEDEHSATVRVVLVGSGYLSAFDVDCDELPKLSCGS